VTGPVVIGKSSAGIETTRLLPSVHMSGTALSDLQSLRRAEESGRSLPKVQPDCKSGLGCVMVLNIRPRRVVSLARHHHTKIHYALSID